MRSFSHSYLLASLIIYDARRAVFVPDRKSKYRVTDIRALTGTLFYKFLSKRWMVHNGQQYVGATFRTVYGKAEAARMGTCHEASGPSAKPVSTRIIRVK